MLNGTCKMVHVKCKMVHAKPSRINLFAKIGNFAVFPSAVHILTGALKSA